MNMNTRDEKEYDVYAKVRLKDCAVKSVGWLPVLENGFHIFVGRLRPAEDSAGGWPTKEMVQAQWLTRSYLIMLGEGFRTNFAFYFCDYPGEPGYEKVTSSASWQTHQEFFARQWAQLKKVHLEPVGAWRQTELAAVSSMSATLIYPFSGPDFFSAQSVDKFLVLVS